MVKSISKIAQKKMSEATMWGNENLEEELALKVMALKTIVTITKSLADWSQELYEPPVDLATIQQKTQGMPAAAEDGNVTEESLAPPTRTREPDVYEAQKQLKVQLDKGKELFKLSCKKGMEFFHEHGMVERNPEDIAKFLRNTPGLDKAKIGEYLGEPYVASVD
jgi:brefeldin A-inhibited guanine nucleotide-exchange protein